MSFEPRTSHLRAALAELEPAYRELSSLHAFGHLSDEQIAERRSIRPVIVAPLLGRARRKPREGMGVCVLSGAAS
jgi:DNA-directed RNA polymerase specialized sigma24 family protein